MGEEKVTAFKLDVLRELANIGTGNAVTSLAQLLNEEKITMDVPAAVLVPLQDVPEILGGAELPVAGVFIESTGDIQLTFLFIIPLESALNLISILLPAAQGNFDALELSALLEVGNILTSSYLNALSLMIDLPLLPSPPVIAIDMAGAIISTVMAEALVLDDELVLLQTKINSRQKHISGQILIIPSRGALDNIFTRLGIK